MVQYAMAILDAQNDLIESMTGSSALLLIRTGAAPANCQAANQGTVLATINLPADWMNASSGGLKTKLGTWADAAQDAAGTAGHFRIYNTAGTTCFIQGTVGVGSGDLQLSTLTFTGAGASFTINSFTLNNTANA